MRMLLTGGCWGGGGTPTPVEGVPPPLCLPSTPFSCTSRDQPALVPALVMGWQSKSLRPNIGTGHQIEG